MTWTLRFWGVRGSVPVPGAGTVRYGGNTPCVTLEGDGPPVVIDAGTGLRTFGLSRLAADASEIHLVLTHTHWDHIQGLPFFPPLYEAAGRVRVYGPRQDGGLRTVLDRLTVWENFPIASARWAGLREVTELEEGRLAVAGWETRTIRLCHPGHTLGYRFGRPGVAPAAYLSDNELAGNAHGLGPGWYGDLVDFLSGVRVLVHDTTWSDAEGPARRGWGHSSPREAIRLAADAGCERLVLFHHNPEHDDAMVDRHLAQARRDAKQIAGGPEIEAAREGMALTLDREG